MSARILDIDIFSSFVCVDSEPIVRVLVLCVVIMKRYFEIRIDIKDKIECFLYNRIHH